MKMKKILTLLLALTLVFTLFACGKKDDDKNDDDEKPSVEVMTYEEFNSAALEAKVVVESYVQATQDWWDNKITVYLQDEVGAYFAYEMACSEEDAAKLIPGTKIRVTGYKAEWAGEVEIVDASFEILEGTYVATATDVTALLGTDDLIAKQNMFVLFKEMTVKAIEFKNGEPGDDIYVTLTKGGVDYDFCVERYLTGPETAVYAAVSALKAGDVIDVEGFLYWYNGVNTHITGVTVLPAEVVEASENETPVVVAE
jgi:predicted small lipoprotein YifL